jgi:hypothetical protein
MVEPTEDQILQKAKELCRNDGKAWDRVDLEKSASQEVSLAGVADDSGRTEYLNQATAALKNG